MAFRGPPPWLRRRAGRPTLSNEELLDKALEQFPVKGFAGTSIDAICAAAGMARAARLPRAVAYSGKRP